MAKSEKKVVRIIIVILISFMLFILYMSRPIFGIPIFDFREYTYEFLSASPENRINVDYDEKTKNIIISIENGENQDIYILRGEVYENNVLKEKFSVNKNIQETKKKYNSSTKFWTYQIHKLPEIKVNSEFKMVIYYKDKNGEHSSSASYRYEKNPFFPYTMLYPDW